MQVYKYNESTTIVYVCGSGALKEQNGTFFSRILYALVDNNINEINKELTKHIIFNTTIHSITSVALDRINNWLYITEWNITHVCKNNGNISVHDQVIQYGKLINCKKLFEQPYYLRHGWHITEVNPITGDLCISFGVDCNYKCGRKLPESTISCFNDMNNPSINNMTIYANGIRDSIGIAFHPITNKMWFTDHNRDNMGDNRPDCELNVVNFIGQEFGHPWCHSIGTGSQPIYLYIGGS